MNNSVLLTSIPSPYMVELIDAVNSTGRWTITPLYENLHSAGRQWNVLDLRHEHRFLVDSGTKVIQQYVEKSDLVISGSLWGRNVNELLRSQKKACKPLVIWAEKPGAVHQNPIANIIRRLAIRNRFGHAHAVWGIGDWAIKEYQRCLPSVRQFANMPYASNLDPYFAIHRGTAGSAPVLPLKFLYSGSLIYRKGVDLLVSATIKLLEEGYNICLTLMGHGELELQLRAKIPQKYDNSITFTGFKDWHELPLVYAEHDLLVAPSRYDGWGLIVMEGLAAGMPVIASDMMGSAIDFIKHNQNGWIFPAGDENALYVALKQSIFAPVNEIGLAARKSVEGWSLEKAAKRWCDLADDTLKNSK